jgi:TolB protein
LESVTVLPITTFSFKKKKTKYLVSILLLIFIYACERYGTNDHSSFIPPYEPAQWYGSPTWSPDGDWIAFTFYKVVPESVFFVHPDGSDLHSLTRGFNADFSPSGGKLALNIGNQIFVYDISTGLLNQITFEGSSYFPDWSPDGKRMAYDSNYQDSSEANVIWLMDSDGTKKKDVSVHGIGEWRMPNWLSNYKILHIRYTADPQIFIMDSSGRFEEQLTDDKWNIFPEISPYGNKIVWQRWDLHENTDIFLMNADGSGKELLVKDAREPAWSPDGEKIVYWKYGVFTPGEPWSDDDPKVHGSLWIYDLSNNEHQQVLP